MDGGLSDPATLSAAESRRGAGATRSQPIAAFLEWHATTGDGEAGMLNGWTAWTQAIPLVRSASRGGGAGASAAGQGAYAKAPCSGPG